VTFEEPTEAALAQLRADPLIFEQELDVRSEIAESLERALGFRAGRKYWRGMSGHLYAVELGDFGRGRPSMAILYGFWPRYEPRPLDEAAIDADLAVFLRWMAETCAGLDAADFDWTLERSPRSTRRQGERGDRAIFR
jgi:hypothetical protein